jgi:hypothetical protein
MEELQKLLGESIGKTFTMYFTRTDYISGKLTKVSPCHVVLETADGAEQYVMLTRVTYFVIVRGR